MRSSGASGTLPTRLTVLWDNYNFYQVLLLVYFKGGATDKQLIGQNPDGPEIDLLIIALALEQLGGKVEGRATEGTPELFLLDLIDCPSEIAQLDIALNKPMPTMMSTIFSGLISRCRIWFKCMQLTAYSKFLVMKEVASSVRFLCWAMMLYSCPSHPSSSRV